MSLEKLLANRFTGSDKKNSKVQELAQQTSHGKRSSFSGFFSNIPLTEKETAVLELILDKYKNEETDIHKDLLEISSITCEVKAIHKQAALLHGERIHTVQKILKNYKEGAFTQWLLTTYGNRQTPYNFLQYYELYQVLPENLRDKMKNMPQQAIYTLAARTGEQEKKESFIDHYNGETKQELLSRIQETFPLKENDKRQVDHGQKILAILQEQCQVFNKRKDAISIEQKQDLEKFLEKFLFFIKKSF